MSSSATRRSPTVWIWLLIIVAVVIGLLNLLDAARLMGWLPIAALGDLKFFLPGASWVGALMYVVLAAIWFWAAKKLYDLDPSGWLFVVAIAVLNIVFLLLALLGQTTFQAIALELAANAVALIIGLLPSTKAAFGQ